MEVFHSNQSAVHYTISGEGQTVILLHGFLEDHSMWDNIVPSLVDWGFQCICMDLPCHGQSRFDGENCSMQYMAEIVDSFCTEKKIENPFVFGHSMGGYVGLELLKLRPLKLTLVHSNFWEDSPKKKYDRDRLVGVVEKNKTLLVRESIPYLFTSANRVACEAAIQKLISKACEIPKNEIIAASRGLRDRSENGYLLDLHDISMIQGDNDPVVPLETLENELKKTAEKTKDSFN